MKLFDHVRLKPPREITEHEASGRFIPLTQIRSSSELSSTIANLVPLLHAPKEVADPIRYVFSEMVRNALEHSESRVGAFVCAQYYAKSKRISIGIADAGIGIEAHMRKHHRVATAKEAINLALQPGITGTTSRIGGNEFNAGAGLFFTKSIASFSQNMFLLYSGDAAYRLMKGPRNRGKALNSDPNHDYHLLATDLPDWPGTLVGIDINVAQGVEFAELLDQIRKAYFLDVKRKENYAKKIKFT
jgi:anti-sigma regulatory factor (Ser/Thr protein kinase)